MSQLLESLKTCEIQKGLNLIGLKISVDKMNELTSGNTILLEGKSLGETGSLLIFAEALAVLNLFKSITFEDLLKAAKEPSHFPGIPIHCWNCAITGKCCLYLTLVEDHLALKLNYMQLAHVNTI